MTDDVIELLKAQLPQLFARAVAELERRAAAGDVRAAERLTDLDAPAAALVRVHGAAAGQGELRLHSERRVLVVASGPSASEAAPFGHALALPAAAARYGLGLLAQAGGELEQLVSAWAVLVSPAARDALAGLSYGFEVVIARVPVIGDLRAAVSLGRPRLPAQSEFTLSIDYDELEDAREQQLAPQQLFLAGKVRIDGDAAMAMMLGMTLAQLR
jgi:hypothetical protein